MFLGIRLITHTYVYDDPDRPDRVTSVIPSPAYTIEDHALLMGLDTYEASLCRCGFPKEVAWHGDMDGWFDGAGSEFVCHACTARNGGRQVVYTRPPVNTRPADKPLSPLVIGLNTTPPDAPSTGR